MTGGTFDQDAVRRQHEVIAYWRLIELFSPQKVDRPDPKNTYRPSIHWRPGRPLPWDTLRPAGKSGEHEMCWQHTIHLGVYRIESIYEHLHSVFPSDPDAYDERPDGLSACAAVVIDDAGRLMADSETLSSAAWAIGRTVSPGIEHPTWFDGFDRAQNALTDRLDEYVADLKNDRDLVDDPRVDAEILQALLHITQSAAGVIGVDSLGTSTIYITSTRVRRDRSAELQGFDFLNSFFLDDLGKVGESEFGAALNQYLTTDESLPTHHRIDVRANPDVVIEGTGYDRLPPGRWPSNPDHPLATSQQFAVNEALHTLGRSSGLMGVNGPPGTGKTTMLRDLLAGNVVRRAEVLASLAQPDQAFTDGKYEWKGGDFPRRVRQLRTELTGYEMVVASSNNAAVANVSDELPQQEQIHDTWHADADYFADLASAIASKGFQGDGAVPRSWGLVAARLGNSSNRNAFHSTFWFGKGTQEEPHSPDDGVVHGMQRLLKYWEKAPESRPSWDAARANFVAARREVDHFTDQARAAANRLARLGAAARELEMTTAALQQLSGHCSAAERAYAQLYQHGAGLHATTVSWGERRDRHMDARPSWFESLTSGGKASKRWRGELTQLNATLTAAEQAEQQHNVQAQHSYNALRAALDEKSKRERDITTLQHEVAQLRERTLRDAELYGRCYPGADWLQNNAERELHGAWQHPDFNRARSDLFIAALDLHKAFLANATGIRQGLRASLDVMLGVAPRELDPRARLAAWQLLFLAVPLISTTFASVSRMLRGLDRESLGWLLIDEAGQATPQAAVGAIWRTKRVIAVGDPLQLTPVVTMPKRAQHDLALRFNVTNTWVPGYTSVQQLADRVGRYGTTLTNGELPTWVSAPLRVHRRCDSPMFEVSNTVAYENMMINGVHRGTQARAEFEQIPASQWIDVPGPVPGNHLQVAEIERLRTEISQLLDAGLNAADIIAISPFRAVSQQLKRLAEDYPGMTGGTIHTAQGREAPVVFLVLGGDPKRAGAKRWASSTPNLVNVAASRAQRRLYVIGDREGWRNLPNFSVLAAKLSDRNDQ